MNVVVAVAVALIEDTVVVLRGMSTTTFGIGDVDGSEEKRK